MKKNYKEEIHERIKSRIKEKFGTTKARWFIIIINLLAFSIVCLYSFITWGKDVAVQYIIQTLATFVLIDSIIYFTHILIWRWFSIPQEIFNELSEENENLQSLISTPVSIHISQTEDEVNDPHIFKQIKLVSRSPQLLLSCFATIENFCELLPDGTKKNIEPVSRQISWSTTGRRTGDNKVDLVIGIPEKLYLVRKDNNEKRFYLMGEKGNNTPLKNKGKYEIQIRFNGNNFSPHIFNVIIELNGRGSLKITGISKLSLLNFFNANVGMKANLDINLTEK